MRDESGRWVVTDVNPRMGGGTAMSLAGGLDFAAAHLAYHWNEDWKPFLPELDRERYVARYYSHVSL